MSTDEDGQGDLKGPPWRHVRVYGHDLDNVSGLLYLQALVPLDQQQGVELVAARYGLTLDAETDGQASGHVLLETIGDGLVIEQLAKELVMLGIARM